MKKAFSAIISFFLVLNIFIPDISLSENTYTSKLGMTMDEFILKYNAVPATLESPYKPLGKPARWTDFKEYKVAWFYPEGSSSVAILLMSADKANIKSTKAGLDAIEIYSFSKESWIPLLCVTKRCAGIFGEELFGLTTSSFATIETIIYYYENDLEKKGYTSYRTINADETIALSFGYSDGYYYSITSIDDAR